MVITLKQLLLKNENWYRYHQFYSEHGDIRPAVEYSINKIISCRHYARGHAQYYCSNPSCTHEKRVLFSCKDRGCSACGKVATDNWLLKQKEILPPCPFQHITFTMPKVLSDFFKTNRRLLNRLPALAGTILNHMAKKKGLTPGIFMALHTFGRKLNWNVHLHVSITQGGLTADNTWGALSKNPPLPIPDWFTTAEPHSPSNISIIVQRRLNIHNCIPLNSLPVS